MQGDNIYGTRARIGLIVPSSNTATEAEFNALRPAKVSLHSARMLLTHGTIEQLARMAQDTEMAAELIATARPSIVAFACTTGSLFGGPGWDEKLIERIQKITKVPTTTTSTAVIRAFREMGIKKVAVGTPYNEELNKVEVVFFEAAGIKVLEMKGLDLTVEEMHHLPLERYMELARQVNKPDADAVFLSCTNLKAVPIVESLEKELGKPVFSSNIATFWDVMCRLGIKEPIKGHGRLLASI